VWPSIPTTCRARECKHIKGTLDITRSLYHIPSGRTDGKKCFESVVSSIRPCVKSAIAGRSALVDSARTQTHAQGARVHVWRCLVCGARGTVVGYGSHGCERTGREQSVQQAVPAHQGRTLTKHGGRKRRYHHHQERRSDWPALEHE